MSKFFKIHYPNDAIETYKDPRIVASGTAASITPGVPTKQGSSGAVALMADGDGTTSQRFTGMAKNTSTETSTVAGKVEIFFPFPGIIYEGFSKSAASSNTQALIDALIGSRVPFDLTAGDWTVDAAASDANTNSVVIQGGDYNTSTLFFTVGITGSSLL